jgi:hypothetical protein
MNNFRNQEDNKFLFMLRYPELSNNKAFTFKQSDNPFSVTSKSKVNTNNQLAVDQSLAVSVTIPPAISTEVDSISNTSVWLFPIQHRLAQLHLWFGS